VFPEFNVREWAEKLLFKTVLGRVLPSKRRSVVVRLVANGDEEKFKDVPSKVPVDVVNQSLFVVDAPVPRVGGQSLSRRNKGKRRNERVSQLSVESADSLKDLFFHDRSIGVV